jgi:diamine N-acetyltransferase
MNTSIREITTQNYDQVINLRTRADQTHVATNAESMAEAARDPDDKPIAIYDGETPVGFVMYSLDHEGKFLWISRFMIDKDFQGKGYGRATLELLKQIAMDDPGIIKLALSTEKDNTEGIAFYTKFGFKDTGRTLHDEEDGEEVFELDLEK